MPLTAVSVGGGMGELLRLMAGGEGAGVSGIGAALNERERKEKEKRLETEEKLALQDSAQRMLQMYGGGAPAAGQGEGGQAEGGGGERFTYSGEDGDGSGFGGSIPSQGEGRGEDGGLDFAALREAADTRSGMLTATTSALSEYGGDREFVKVFGKQASKIPSMSTAQLKGFLGDIAGYVGMKENRRKEELERRKAEAQMGHWAAIEQDAKAERGLAQADRQQERVFGQTLARYATGQQYGPMRSGLGTGQAMPIDEAFLRAAGDVGLSRTALQQLPDVLRYAQGGARKNEFDVNDLGKGRPVTGPDGKPVAGVMAVPNSKGSVEYITTTGKRLGPAADSSEEPVLDPQGRLVAVPFVDAVSGNPVPGKMAYRTKNGYRPLSSDPMAEYLAGIMAEKEGKGKKEEPQGLWEMMQVWRTQRK